MSRPHHVGPACTELKNTKETGVFLMPHIPFEFECERPNNLCMAELSFGCSEIFTRFLLRTAKARHF